MLAKRAYQVVQHCTISPLHMLHTCKEPRTSSLLCHTCTDIQLYLSTTVSGAGLHGNRGINIEGRSRQKFPEVSYGDDTSPVLQVTQLVEECHLQWSDLSILPCFSQQLA